MKYTENVIYDMANSFLKKYPFTIAFRIRMHSKVLAKHINPDEEIYYLFPAQKNYNVFDIFSTCLVALTNKRIIIAQKRVIPGYRLSSVTPDLFNDFQVFKGLLFGKINIDTVKEVIQLSNLDPKCLPEVETELSEYLLKVKPKVLKEKKESN